MNMKNIYDMLNLEFPNIYTKPRGAMAADVHITHQKDGSTRFSFKGDLPISSSTYLKVSLPKDGKLFFVDAPAEDPSAYQLCRNEGKTSRPYLSVQKSKYGPLSEFNGYRKLYRVDNFNIWYVNAIAEED